MIRFFFPEKSFTRMYS